MQTLDAQLSAMIPEWTTLVRSLLPTPGWLVTRYDEPCEDTVHATEEAAQARADELDETTMESHSVCPLFTTLTVGFTPATEERDASWGYQTGDNSFTGGAYGNPHWAVVTLTADSDPATVANEIADQIGELCIQ